MRRSSKQTASAKWVAMIAGYQPTKRKTWRQPKVKEPEPKRIIVIDGNNMLWRGFYVSSGPLGAVYSFIRQLGHQIKKFDAKRCYICWDGKFGSKRRKELYPEYKQGREKQHLDFKTFYDQFPLLRKLLRFLSVIQVEHPELEADDSMASIVNLHFEKTEQYVLITSDKDLLAQVKEKVSVYQPVKEKLITSKNFSVEFGLTPEQYFQFRVLSGDASDKLKGVLGPKGAMWVIQNFGTIDKFLDALEKAKQKGGKTLVKKKNRGLHKIQERIAEHERVLNQKKFASVDSPEKVEALKRNLELMNPKLVNLDSYFERGQLREERLKRIFLKAGFVSLLAPYWGNFISRFRELET